MEVTTVAARGEAEAAFNVVGFAVALTETSSSVRGAKGKLAERIKDLDTALSELKERLGLEFVKNSLRSTSRVNEKYEYNREACRNDFVGFEITYDLNFDIDDMDRVNEVYDALTSLDKVRVGQPTFRLKNRDKVNKKALKDAFEKVRERFEMECQVLGLDAEDFEIGTWEVSYSDSQRSPKVTPQARVAMAAGAPSGGANRGFAEAAESSMLGGGDSAINFVAGVAHITVNLEVGYHPKTRNAVRLAKIVKDFQDSSSTTSVQENGRV